METEGRPRLRGWLDQLQARNLLESAVVYGYFPCHSKGDDLILLNEDGSERTRFTFPRQRRGRRLCLADFFRPEESGETDVVGLQVVTIGSKVGLPPPLSCSRTTTTGTTWSCTGSPSSWPRPWPSSGTPGSAPSWASRRRTPTRWQGCSI